jgi:hypothetical protein
MLAVVVPGAAQGGVEFTPFAGLYVPAVHVIDISAFCPGGPCGEVVTQEIAPLVGAHVTNWLRDRLALDFSFAYARTTVRRKGLLAEVSSGMLVGEMNDTVGAASIMNGSARLLIGLTPRSSRASYFVAAGLALVGHSGPAYAHVAGNTGWGPVVGAVGRFQVTPTLTVRAEVTDYIYSFSGIAVTSPPDYSLGVVAGNYRSQMQHDLLLSFGVALTPFGREKAP